jgi:hypothetical protein
MSLISGQGLSQSAYFIWSTKGNNSVLKCGWHSKGSDVLFHVVRHFIDATHDWSGRQRNSFCGNNTGSSIVSLSVVIKVHLDFLDGTIGEEDANVTSKKLM